ncbi:MAG: CopG family antitoxin [Alphaproteobacteria bacterium]
MTNRKHPIFNLDEEEKRLSDSFDAGEWESVENLDEEIAKSRKAASLYLSKDKRINIRISSSDLERLKQLAAYEGLPYQTLITSILHKYSAGHLSL